MTKYNGILPAMANYNWSIDLLEYSFLKKLPDHI
jgi:hypothetical protein